MTHASLFSGIGGAELAASWMGWTNLFHCEINPFGRKVLEHWFPNSISYDDITKTDFTTWRGKVDVLTGGFPCQPFSLAGRRKGAEDDRYLWPEMLRAIGEIQPAWVVGENVAGLITMVQPGETADMGRTDDLFEENHLYRTVQEYTLDAIIRSLESIGYAVLSFLVPACAVGAPHRRDRLWIVAHRTDAGTENEPARTVQPHTARHAADTDSDGCGRRTDKPQRKSGSRRQTDARAACKTTTPPTWTSENSCGEGLERCERAARLRNIARTDTEHGEENEYPQARWAHFPSVSPVCRGNDGLPFDISCLAISEPTWRKEAIKALGNAWVPQVAYEIFRAIQMEENKHD